MRGVSDAEIRRAVEDDGPSILALWRDLVAFHRRIESVRPSGWSGPVDETLRPLVDALWKTPDRCVAFVARRGGGTVGFCRAVLTEGGPCDATISTLIVEAGHRSGGIGEALLGVALGWCHEAGARDVSVDVIAPNRAQAVSTSAMGSSRSW